MEDCRDPQHATSALMADYACPRDGCNYSSADAGLTWRPHDLSYTDQQIDDVGIHCKRDPIRSSLDGRPTTNLTASPADSVTIAGYFWRIEIVTSAESSSTTCSRGPRATRRRGSSVESHQDPCPFAM